MQISFTGINNFKMGKKTYDKYGYFITSSGQIKKGEKNYTEIKISCDLSDDENGNDLSEYKKAISKCIPYYHSNIINKKNPEHVDFLTIRQEIDDNGTLVSNSDFKLNDHDVMINDVDILPMIDFMAALSRKIYHLPQSSQAQKNYAKLVNKSVAEEATQFIENY